MGRETILGLTSDDCTSICRQLSKSSHVFHLYDHIFEGICGWFYLDVLAIRRFGNFDDDWDVD